MSPEAIWNTQETVASTLGIRIPQWIDQDIDLPTIASIVQGGCASGAYMPAVTYYDASKTMEEWGNIVLDYLEETYGEDIPAPAKGTSWSGMACWYLSMAVELWASDIMAQLEDLDTGEEG